VAASLSNLAVLARNQNDWAAAADYWRRSTEIIQHRAERGLAGGRGEAFGGEAQRSKVDFLELVKVVHRLTGPGGLSPSGAVVPEMFEKAQWAQGSEAATSLAQMAARSAKGSTDLSALVREQQDLLTERQVQEKRLIDFKGMVPAKRNANAEQAISDRLKAIDSRVAEIDRRLARDFPEYSALASPAPVSVREVQAHLGAEEALVLFLPTYAGKPLPEETFIWVVTKLDVRWARSDLGTKALTREVIALRCGLDAAEWYSAGPDKCAKALGIPVDQTPGADAPLPFDHARAHKLYAALFAEVCPSLRLPMNCVLWPML
jgi:hypothetical protein